MLAKITNGILQYAPKKIYIDNHLVFNPSDEQLKQLGYKEIIYTETPQTQIKGKFWTSRFEDRTLGIEQIWFLADEPSLGAEQLSLELVSKQINTMNLTDEESLYFKSLYPLWEDLCKQKYTTEKEGFKFQYNNKLYKTIQPSLTFQSNWVPDNGTESIYVRIDEEHEGTLNDPIPYDGNMILEKDKYYIQNNEIYKCINNSINPVYNTLEELVKIYTEKVIL